MKPKRLMVIFNILESMFILFNVSLYFESCDLIIFHFDQTNFLLVDGMLKEGLSFRLCSQNYLQFRHTSLCIHVSYQ